MTKKAYRESARVKPLGVEGIEKCRDILVNGYAKVNEVLVDSFTASAIVGVYDRVNDKNKAKMVEFPVGYVAELCFKLLK